MRREWTNCDISSDGLPSGGEKSLRNAARQWMQWARKVVSVTDRIDVLLAAYYHAGAGAMPDWCETDEDYADWAEAVRDECDEREFLADAKRLGIPEVAAKEEMEAAEGPVIYAGEIWSANIPTYNDAHRTLTTIEQ